MLLHNDDIVYAIFFTYIIIPQTFANNEMTTVFDNLTRASIILVNGCDSSKIYYE